MDYLKLAAKLLEHDPKRSTPFHQGLAAVLQNRVDGTLVNTPYAQGSAESDAFFAGRMRAHHEFRNLLIENDGDRPRVIARLQNLAGEPGRRVA